DGVVANGSSWLSHGRFRAASRRSVGGPRTRGGQLSRSARNRTVASQRAGKHGRPAPGNDLLPVALRGAFKRTQVRHSEGGSSVAEGKGKENELTTADLAGRSEKPREPESRPQLVRNEQRAETQERVGDPHRPAGNAAEAEDERVAKVESGPGRA